MTVLTRDQYNTPVSDDKPISVNIPDSSGGVNTRQHETEIKDTEMTVGYNIDISTIGKKKKRLGINTVLNDLGSTPILDLAYMKAPNVDERMVHVWDKRVYKETDPIATSGNWTDIHGGDLLTTNLTTTRMCVTGDLCFITNGTDNVFSYNGTSMTDEGDNTANANPPAGKVITYFLNRLWIANTSAEPDHVFYSNSLAPQTFAQSTQVFKVAEKTNSIDWFKAELSKRVLKNSDKMKSVRRDAIMSRLQR